MQRVLRRALLTAIGLALIPVAQSLAYAPCDLDVLVTFREGAPRDRFTILNDSQSNWTVGAITIDLAPSAGALFFDTDAGGAGFEVFQPFATDAGGAVELRRITELSDGGPRITLDFDELTPGSSFSFSLDVEDPDLGSPAGATQITGSEIEGASVRAIVRNPAGTLFAKEARFENDATARIAPTWCQGLS